MRGHGCFALALSATAIACGGAEKPASSRGAGLAVATESPTAAAAAYAAALGGAFDLGPGLVLLLDPVLLPDAHSADTARALDDAVARALRSRDVVRGTCRPTTTNVKAAPICPAQQPGYVVRVSQLFRAGGDTLQLYIAAERYRPSHDTTGYQAPLHLEQRYHITPRGSGWRVARKEVVVR